MAATTDVAPYLHKLCTRTGHAESKPVASDSNVTLLKQVQVIK